MLSLGRVVRLLAPRKDPGRVLEVFERVKGVAESMGCRAYLIGSWAKGKALPASDVDILVVCRELPRRALERGKMKARILEEAGIPDWWDVHVELVEEGSEWYYLNSQ